MPNLWGGLPPEQQEEGINQLALLVARVYIVSHLAQGYLQRGEGWTAEELVPEADKLIIACLKDLPLLQRRVS